VILALLAIECQYSTSVCGARFATSWLACIVDINFI